MKLERDGERTRYIDELVYTFGPTKDTNDAHRFESKAVALLWLGSIVPWLTFRPTTYRAYLEGEDYRVEIIDAPPFRVKKPPREKRIDGNIAEAHILRTYRPPVESELRDTVKSDAAIIASRYLYACQINRQRPTISGLERRVWLEHPGWEPYSSLLNHEPEGS